MRSLIPLCKTPVPVSPSAALYLMPFYSSKSTSVTSTTYYSVVSVPTGGGATRANCQCHSPSRARTARITGSRQISIGSDGTNCACADAIRACVCHRLDTHLSTSHVNRGLTWPSRRHAYAMNLLPISSSLPLCTPECRAVTSCALSLTTRLSGSTVAIATRGRHHC
jgi:hypothetical protein